MECRIRCSTRPGVASRQRTVAVHAAVKSTGAKQVVCSKTITARPERREQVAKVLAEMEMYSMEQAKERSSGVLSFQCVRDGWEEDVFHCYERYTNNGAMQKHNMDPKMMKMMEEKLLPQLQGPMGWAMYEWKNGQLGNACVPEGPKGEGGLDDATGASGAAGGASMKRTSAATPVISGLEHERDNKKEHDKTGAVLDSVKKQLQSFFSFGNINKK